MAAPRIKPPLRRRLKPATLNYMDEGVSDDYAGDETYGGNVGTTRPVMPVSKPANPPSERRAPLAVRDAEKSDHRKGQRLKPAELITIAQLDENEVSINDIARALNRHATTIRANLKASRQLLKAFAPDFVKDWKEASAKAAQRGDHRPAMDALERMRVVTPLPKAAEPGSQPIIQVGIALPGLPASSEPIKTITATATEETEE